MSIGHRIRHYVSSLSGVIWDDEKNVYNNQWDIHNINQCRVSIDRFWAFYPSKPGSSGFDLLVFEFAAQAQLEPASFVSLI